MAGSKQQDKQVDLRLHLTAKSREMLDKFSIPHNRELRTSDINAAYVKDALLKALRQNRCNVSEACEAAGVSRTTYNNYILYDPIFAELVAEIREANIDLAESKLIHNIERGFEASIIFFLKTQARRRGYSEVTGAPSSTYEESLSERADASLGDLSDSQLSEHINELRGKLGVGDSIVGGFNISDFEIVEDAEMREERFGSISEPPKDIIIKREDVDDRERSLSVKNFDPEELPEDAKQMYESFDDPQDKLDFLMNFSEVDPKTSQLKRKEDDDEN